MSKFVTLQKTWELDVNVPVRKTVLADAGVDLFAALDEKIYQQLADPETLINVLWSMCKEQAGDSITSDQFARSIKGDIYEAAADALKAAIADFFPIRQRQTMKKVMTALTEMTNHAYDQADQKIDALEAEMKSGKNSITSQELSASPPAV